MKSKFNVLALHMDFKPLIYETGFVKIYIRTHESL